MTATLYRAAWVVPVASPAIPHGEVLVGRDGTIAAVAPAGALDLPADLVVRDLGAAILIPGLVNVHAHPELAMFRGALEDLPFRDWILRLVGGKRAALGPEDAFAAARWTTVEAIAAGMTTIAATESSSAALGAMAAAGLRGIVYQEVFGPDPAMADDAIRQLEAEVDRLAAESTDLVRVGISPHAPFTVSDELYRAAARLASDGKLPMAVHIAESRAERDLVAAGGGDFAPGLRERGIDTPVRARSPVALLERLGVLDARPLLIHCVDVDDEDIDSIERSGCAVAHCPVANAKLGHGIAPIPKLFRAGVTIGIGTDSVASNNRLDLFEEARFAALLQRASGRSHALLSAEELLRLCTIDGARALGLDDRIGTLEPGKDADLCAVAIDRPHTIPIIDPLDTLFHSARATDVILTAVRGEVLYDSGEHRSVDVAGLRSCIEAIAARLREAM